MIVRDTLIFDQMAGEVVPRRNKIPFEFWAVDGSTIRIASPDRDAGMHFSYHHRNNISPLMQPHRFGNMYDRQFYGETEPVGFDGELSIIIFVLSVIAFSMFSGKIRNSSRYRLWWWLASPGWEANRRSSTSSSPLGNIRRRPRASSPSPSIRLSS